MKGIKYSGNKLPMSKLFIQFPNALKAVMLASMFGHIKYEEFDSDFLNYRRVEGQNYSDALVRHLLLKDESDEESQLHPKFHIAWNALADLEKYIEENKIDINNLSEHMIFMWRKSKINI